MGIHLSNTSYLSPYGPCHRLTVILPTNPLHSLPQIHRPLYVLSFPLIQCQHVTPLPGLLRIPMVTRSGQGHRRSTPRFRWLASTNWPRRDRFLRAYDRSALLRNPRGSLALLSRCLCTTFDTVLRRNHRRPFQNPEFHFPKGAGLLTSHTQPAADGSLLVPQRPNRATVGTLPSGIAVPADLEETD